LDRTKILYIIDELGPGGAERRLVQLLGRLDRSRFSATLILLTDIIHYREIFDLDIEVVVLKRRIPFDPLVFFNLYGICKRWRPAVIHAWGSLPAVYAGPVARIMKIKLINAMIANAPRRLSRQQGLRARLTFPFSDIIQSNSHAGLRAYGVPQGKGNVIHNGLDFGRLEGLRDGEEVRGELHIGTRHVAGMVAGFHPLKDYESLLEAARIVLGRRDDVTFVCVGGGTDLERIRNEGNFSDRIIFTGKRNDVESIVQIFDIGILSTYSEGISNSIMEYMALGKPVIASEGGGTVELVVDGETGFIIPQRSPRVLAERIEHLLDDAALRETMGRKGLERIRERFSIERMTDEHMSLYSELARRPD
jgi:glycosyltransferase involved in cell wall biosynthesis